MISFKSPAVCVVVALLAAAAKITVGQPEAKTSAMSPDAFDTAYMADYTYSLTTRLFLSFQNATLLIHPAGEQAAAIVYRPNVNVRVGIAGFWRWFGLGLSIDNPFYKTDRTAYGKTSTIDLRVNAFGRSIAGELFFQQYKGFYLDSPEAPDGSHYIVPDMQTMSIGIAGYWIYNAGRFSVRAAFIQNERQKKSAGSLLVRPAFIYYRISSDQGIIPPGVMEKYHAPLNKQIVKGTFYSVELAPGYAYTLVFLKNLYFTAAVFPGVAAQFSSYSNDVDIYDDFEFAFQLSGRFAVGYNSDKWFIGGSVQSGFNEIPSLLNKTMFSYDVTQFRIWGGTRFDIFRKKKNTY